EKECFSSGCPATVPLTRCCSLLRPDPRLRQCRPVTLQPRNFNGRGSPLTPFYLAAVIQCARVPRKFAAGNNCNPLPMIRCSRVSGHLLTLPPILPESPAPMD